MKENEPIIIALDGPAGAGKSTVARMLADHFGVLFIDTGAMYRAVGLKALRAGVDVDDFDALAELMDRTSIALRYEDGAQHVYLDGEDVNALIRTPAVSKAASDVSKAPAVRIRLVEVQRETAERAGAVLDGRDIGTFVLPNAKYKFYLTATPQERARRRTLEMRQKGQDADYEAVLASILDRDRQDSGRAFAPLKRACDALEIDSTGRSAEDVFRVICSSIEERRD